MFSAVSETGACYNFLCTMDSFQFYGICYVLTVEMKISAVTNWLMGC